MVDDSNAGGGAEGFHPRRRPRYRGTHPKRFEEKYKERDAEAYPEMQAHVRAQGRTPAGSHVPVLVEETLACLELKRGDVVADCTLGHGGHALRILERIGPDGLLVGVDVDGAELARTRRRLVREGVRVSLHRIHFAGIGQLLGKLGLDGYDAIVADLGSSSMQLDDPARGFSFKHAGPLDMRMDDRERRTAADLLRLLSERELSLALRDLADEPDHARIARRIVEKRSRRPVARTLDLVELVLEAKGLSRDVRREAARPGDLHPAARTFQALRILVNDEMSGLEQLLRIAPHCLRPGGRIAIIAFHSGEDRRVERAFRDGRARGLYAEVSDEPVRPGAAERRANPRSESAKLRWARLAPHSIGTFADSTK